MTTEIINSEHAFICPEEKKAETLAKVLKSIDTITRTEKTVLCNISLLVITDETDEAYKILTYTPGDNEISPKSIVKMIESAVSGAASLELKDILTSIKEGLKTFFKQSVLKKDSLRAIGYTDSMLKDISSVGYLIKLCDSGQIMMADERLLPTIGQVVKLDGLGLIEHSDYDQTKFGFLSLLMFEKSCPITLVYREIGKVRRAYYVGSTRFSAIPQSTLLKIVSNFTKEFGTPQVGFYNISNYFTDIDIEFPDKAEEFSDMYGLADIVTPCIHIQTSDVAAAAFEVKGCYKVRGKYVYFDDAVGRKHCGAVDLTDLEAEVEKRIFSKFSKLPEALLSLSAIEINDPIGAIPKINKKMGLISAIGKKNEIIFRNFLTAKINKSLIYTAYDMVMLYMENSACVKVCRTLDSEYKKALGNLAYLDFEKLDSSSEITIKDEM